MFAGVGLALLIAAVLGRTVELAGNKIPGPETRASRALSGVVGVVCLSIGLIVESGVMASITTPQQEAQALTTNERYLVERVPAPIASSCRGSNRIDAEVRGAIAELGCPLADPDASYVSYFRFPEADSLRSWWNERLSQLKLQPDSGGCSVGRIGETGYTGGRLMCHVDGGVVLSWLDERAVVYGMALGRQADVSPLVDWWSRTHDISGIQPGPRFQPAEQGLVDAAPGEVSPFCVPYRIISEGEIDIDGDIGGIDCRLDGSVAASVGYFQFPTRDRLDRWWASRRSRETLPPGGCADGSSGVTTWEQGSIMCFTVGGIAQIRWTDEGRLVYGSAIGATRDIGDLFAWWNRLH